MKIEIDQDRLADEYKHLLPVEIYDGLYEVRQSISGDYIVRRKHEWFKREYKAYKCQPVEQVLEAEWGYYNKCKWGF